MHDVAGIIPLEYFTLKAAARFIPAVVSIITYMLIGRQTKDNTMFYWALMWLTDVATDSAAVTCFVLSIDGQLVL